MRTDVKCITHSQWEKEEVTIKAQLKRGFGCRNGNKDLGVNQSCALEELSTDFQQKFMQTSQLRSGLWNGASARIVKDVGSQRSREGRHIGEA